MRACWLGLLAFALNAVAADSTFTFDASEFDRKPLSSAATSSIATTSSV